MTEPKLDPEAGAEILYMQLEIDDSATYVDYRVYVRMKVFSERGLEDLSPVDLETFGRSRIKDLEARVIKADGTVLEVEKRDVFSRRTQEKGKAERKNTWSFSLPGLEPGCIFEYRFTERVPDQSAHGSLFSMTRDFPIHRVSFRFKPYPGSTFKYMMLTPGKKELTEGKRGYWEVELTDIAAAPDEPHLPAYYSIRSWVLVYYIKNSRVRQDVEGFWEEYCKGIYDAQERYVKHKQRVVKDKAAELVAGAATQEESLRRIYDFCKHGIVNLSAKDYDESGESIVDEDEENDDPSDTLKAGRGTAWDINMLFASLAQAAGMEVRLARCNDRFVIDFVKEVQANLAFPDWIVAVKTGDRWSFFDPGTPYLPLGMLHYSNENALAMVGNKKEIELWTVPASPPATSLVNRNGRFAIDEDGTLTGAVKITYRGHEAWLLKRRYSGKSPAEMKDQLVEDVRDRLSNAELRDIVMENISDPDADPVVSYNVEVPGYADVVGGRIFLVTSYFERGLKPVFQKEKRVTDIRFPFTWQTEDEVWFSYPDGYELEEGASPRSVLDSENFAHKAVVGKSKTRNRIVFRRLERVGVLDVPVAAYEPVKNFFDQMHAEDQHVLSLRKQDASATGSGHPPEAQADGPQ